MWTLSAQGETEEMAEKVFKEMEALHILVNNAGITTTG